jgi:coenzyme F420-reducing hydrogenase delta subunit/ferredoxin
VALICNWCTYAGADMAGTTRRAYPATVRAVRVPCTGRIDPLLILKAFEQGADGVVVSGCHPGDCHYVQGNYFARRRFTAFRALVEFLGLDPRRLHFAWVSASEGVKWSQLVAEATAAVREAGPIGDWAAVSKTVPSLPEVPPAPRDTPPPADQEAVAGHLRALAASLLEQQKASVVIGYGAGPLPGAMVPTFVTQPAEAAQLGWSDQCFNDLAVYLPMARRKWGKVAVVVKRCDAGAAVGLLRESQIAREDVTLIGVSCPGVWQDGKLALKCYACDGEVAPVCDWTVAPGGAKPGAVPSGAGRATAADPRDALVEHLESLPAEQRRAYWLDQFERCLRCYGCRAVCPLCYCQVCVADKNQPQWVPTSIDAEGNLVWNVTRAFHLAGRCGGCDECARVCPADIRLDLLNHRLTREVTSRFGGDGRLDPAVPASLVTFRPEDPQEFIR